MSTRKISVHIEEKGNAKKTRRHNPIKILIKIILVISLIGGIYYTNQSHTNMINLLAVTENSNGDIMNGSIVELSLEARQRGSGKIYMNLNTLKETDIQISIINSHKIACDLFQLDCHKYDFFYEFSENTALVLKGPSGSSAIAILVAKTLNKEKIPQDIAITGSLNSGGLIGIVGGIEDKVKTAQKNNITKVLIPIFAQYDETMETTIQVTKALDIIYAYNEFGGRKYELPTQETNNDHYKKLMQDLSAQLCQRTLNLKNQVNYAQITPNSSEKQYLDEGEKSFNSSQIAKKNSNFYSQGSFCFNANINYRTLVEKSINASNEELNRKIQDFESKINKKKEEINSHEYKNKLSTINDFYVYLILTDRLEESHDLIREAKNSNSISINKNETQNTTKITIQNAQSKNEKEILYSHAIERFETVLLWEKLIVHQDTQIKFDDRTISHACTKINKLINLKAELLKKYEVTFLNDEINNQLKLNAPKSNNYLCIYRGFELNGRIDALLNSIGINESQTKEYSSQIINFTKTRINLNTNGNFPLIPTIYSEYSSDLFKEEDYSSSILYSNFALSYSDLNLYLEKEEETRNLINVFNNPVFLLASFILIIII